MEEEEMGQKMVTKKQMIMKPKRLDNLVVDLIDTQEIPLTMKTVKRKPLPPFNCKESRKAQMKVAPSSNMNCQM